MKWDVDKAIINAKNSNKSLDSNDLLRKRNYDRSYSPILSYSLGVAKFDEDSTLMLLNATYGWMPTSVRLCKEDIKPLTNILNKVKAYDLNNGVAALSSEEIIAAAEVVGSVVGLSKMLHFVSPENFAIMDSVVLSRFAEKASPKRMPQSNRNGETKKDTELDVERKATLRLNKIKRDVLDFKSYNEALTKHLSKVEEGGGQKVSLRSLEESLFNPHK